MRPTPRVTKGTCALCHESFAKREVAHHLIACLARHPVSHSVSGLQLLVEGAGAPQYWMHLAASADAKLGELDAFLCVAWLECCHHLSEFKLTWRGEGMGMQSKLGDVLRPRMTLLYAYDFNSPTELTLRVVGEMAHLPEWKAIELLALNECPGYACSVCAEAAQVVDNGDGQPLCRACASEQADADIVLPLINSPRTGVCGYSGPVIRLPTRKAGS